MVFQASATEQAIEHEIDRFYIAVQDSANGASMELPNFSPRGGHGQIKLPDGPEISLEIMLNVTDEIDDIVVFRNVIVSGGAPDGLRRRQKSPFIPMRMYNYIALLSENPPNPCWLIPSEAVQLSWWTEEELVKIAKAALEKFKFFRNTRDWFNLIRDKIIKKFGASHMATAGHDFDDAIAGNCRALNVDEDLVENESETQTGTLPEANATVDATSTPLRFATHLNRECAKRRSGILLKLWDVRHGQHMPMCPGSGLMTK